MKKISIAILFFFFTVNMSFADLNDASRTLEKSFGSAGAWIICIIAAIVLFFYLQKDKKSQ